MLIFADSEMQLNFMIPMYISNSLSVKMFDFKDVL